MRGRVGQPTVPVSLDPDGAFSLRAEDRAAQLRSRAGRFPRRVSAIAPTVTFAYPTPEPVLDFVARSFARADGAARRAPDVADRRPRRRAAVPALELGGRDRRARRRDGRLALDSTSARRSAGSAAYPVTALQRRDLGLRGRVLLRRRLARARFPLFLPRRSSSAAGWCSTARCESAAPATPARSARCRSRRGRRPRRAAAHPCASIYQLERRVERAGADPSSIWRRRRPGRISARRSTPGSRRRRARSPTPRSRRSR